MSVVSYKVAHALNQRAGRLGISPAARVFVDRTPSHDTFSRTLSSLCPHHMVAQSSRCHTTCLHETCSSTCHHMSERLLFPCFVCFLCLSCLYVLSHFYLFSVLNFNSHMLRTPSIKPKARPQNEEYCPVAIYNPLTVFWPANEGLRRTDGPRGGRSPSEGGGRRRRAGKTFRSRPMETLEPGILCFIYRHHPSKRAETTMRGRYLGPAALIRPHGRSSWWVRFGGRAFLCAAEHLRGVTPDEADCLGLDERRQLDELLRQPGRSLKPTRT